MLRRFDDLEVIRTASTLQQVRAGSEAALARPIVGRDLIIQANGLCSGRQRSAERRKNDNVFVCYIFKGRL